MNYDNNEKKLESVYSTRIRAGKRRTYFFDVRATRANDYFLTITESRKRFDNNGYDRHKVFLYKEDFNKFLKALNEAVDYVKTELMPDFDFDAFNHDHYDNEEGVNEGPVVQVATTEEPKVEATIETTPTPATKVETPSASSGDNLSHEDVDKW